MEGWTLSCSCGLSGGSGASDRSDAVTFGAQRLKKRGRGSRNDPLAPSFIPPAQSRAWVIDGSSCDQEVYRAGHWEPQVKYHSGLTLSRNETTRAATNCQTPFIFQTPCEVHPPSLIHTCETGIMVLISDPRLREMKQFAQGHTANQGGAKT